MRTTIAEQRHRITRTIRDEERFVSDYELGRLEGVLGKERYEYWLWNLTAFPIGRPTRENVTEALWWLIQNPNP